MSPIRRKKRLTEEFTVFIIDYQTEQTRDLGKFSNLEEAKRLAIAESSDKLVGFVYGKENRVVFSTLNKR